MKSRMTFCPYVKSYMTIKKARLTILNIRKKLSELDINLIDNGNINDRSQRIALK